MFHVKFSASVVHSAAFVRLNSLNVPPEGEKANPDLLVKKKRRKSSRINPFIKRKKKKLFSELNFFLPSSK